MLRIRFLSVLFDLNNIYFFQSHLHLLFLHYISQNLCLVEIVYKMSKTSKKKKKKIYSGIDSIVVSFVYFL